MIHDKRPLYQVVFYMELISANVIQICLIFSCFLRDSSKAFLEDVQKSLPSIQSVFSYSLIFLSIFCGQLYVDLIFYLSGRIVMKSSDLFWVRLFYLHTV